METVHGDILLDRGLVVGVGELSEEDYEGFEKLSVVDAKGRWVTPGLVDLHSHIGVDSAPHLNGTCYGPSRISLLTAQSTGAADTNSFKAPILPWIRSIDGINTHDMAFELTVSGGVSTAQILPGSAGNIGK
jgi:predicted amidohydrolase